MKLSKALLS